MTLVVYFIFGAVMLGAGAMLSPAYPTSQPRIGLAASLALALVMGGAVFYGTAVEWNTLVVDYMLFVLVIGIFLGGTLSYGQKRAEARGEELADSDQGWPGPWDLLLLFALMATFLLPLLGTAPTTPRALEMAQAADQLRMSGGLYSGGAPGFGALTAYLSNQLAQPTDLTQMAMGAVIAGLCLWIAYDLGAELKDKRLGRILALAMTLAIWLGGMQASGEYDALMGVLFTLTLGLFALRFIREGRWVDVVAGGLMLGALALTHGLALLIGVAVIGIAVALSPRYRLRLLAGAPLVAAIAVSPTLIVQGMPYDLLQQTQVTWDTALIVALTLAAGWGAFRFADKSR
jgi:hypothetical protein